MIDEILKDHLKQHEMINMADFMDLCLSHPTHGYYMTSKIFGTGGDFTTAPEISQMFGEMIGLWLVDVIEKMSFSNRFNLIELGPGRGGLMHDIMRIVSRFKPELDLKINLVEMSDNLQKLQLAKLDQYREQITHYNSFEALIDGLDDAPCLVIANEFFDALPIEQYEYLDNMWFERMVRFKEGKFGHSISKKSVELELPDMLKNRAAEGAIYEKSSAVDHVMIELSKLLKKNNGIMLAIDYGHDGHGFGDTLQAVKNHKFSDIFDHLGNQDLTAHVNFAHLAELSEFEQLKVTEIVTQGDFLIGLGMALRLKMLMKKNPDRAEELQSSFDRLVEKDQMGRLFKALAVYYIDEKYENDFTPAGFALE